MKRTCMVPVWWCLTYCAGSHYRAACGDLGSVPCALPGGWKACWGGAVQQCLSSCQASFTLLAGRVKAATRETLESGGFCIVLTTASEAEERKKKRQYKLKRGKTAVALLNPTCAVGGGHVAPPGEGLKQLLGSLVLKHFPSFTSPKEGIGIFASFNNGIF